MKLFRIVKIKRVVLFFILISLASCNWDTNTFIYTYNGSPQGPQLSNLFEHNSARYEYEGISPTTPINSQKPTLPGTYEVRVYDGTTLKDTRRFSITPPTFGNPGPITICVNGSYFLNPSTTNGTFSTTSPNIATVNSSGYVTGVSLGTTTVSLVGTVTATVTVVASLSPSLNITDPSAQASYKFNNNPQGPVGGLNNYVGYNGFSYSSQARPIKTGFFRASNQLGDAAGCPFEYDIFRCTTCGTVPEYATRPQGTFVGNTIQSGSNGQLTYTSNNSPVGGPFTIVYLPSGGSNITITGKSSGQAIPLGTITSSKTFNLISVTDEISKATTDFSGTIATVSVIPPSAVLSGSTSICSGTTANLSLSTTGTGSITVTLNNGTVFNTVSGTTTFSVTPTTNTTYSIVSVTDSHGNSGAATSSATVTIYAPASITVHPRSSLTIIEGTTATLSVTATGEPTLRYQWYKDGSAISGANSFSYTTTNTTSAAGIYYVTVSTTCNVVSSTTSTVSVTPNPRASLTGTQTICTGTTANLSLITTGIGSITVTLNNGIIVNTVSGTSTISVSPTINTTYTISSVIDTYSSGTSTGSATVSIYAPASITVQPMSSATIIEGATTTLSVTATGQPSLNYQWYKDGSAISGANSYSYTTINTTSASGSYYVTVSTTCNVVSSTTSMVSVTSRPQGSLTGSIIDQGGTGQLTYTSSNGGGPFTIVYQPSGGSNVTVTNVTSGSTISLTTGTPARTTSYSLVSVTDQTTTVSRTSGFSGTTATITVNLYHVGDRYGGGIVFYVDGTGEHGLIAATSNENINQIEWLDAKNACDVKDDGTYSDWRLPTKDELNLMYTNIGNGASGSNKGIGNFELDNYWSSTEGELGYGPGVWAQEIGTSGNITILWKDWSAKVRAIRSF